MFARRVIWALVLWVGVVTTVMGQSADQAKDASSKRILQAQRSLAMRLHTAHAAEGNLVTAPHGLFELLAILHAGAQGETKTELAKLLGAPASSQELGHFQRRLRLASGPLSGNMVFVEKQIRRAEQFDKVVREVFQGEVLAVDFKQRGQLAEAAAPYLEKTFGVSAFDLPPSLPALDNLPENVGFVAVNTITLQKKWQLPFSPNKSHDGEFQSPQEKTTVRYMRQVEEFPYAENKKCQAIQLPLAKSSLSMLVLLPRRDLKLAELEKSCAQPESIAGLVKSMEIAKVDLKLPRFQFSTASSLKPALSQLGLAQVFTHKADFGGLAPQTTLSLADVLQQTSIEVNEAGVKAGGQTQAIGVALSAGRVVKFHAQRPFLFFIGDQQGAIYFTGRVIKPKDLPVID